MGRGAQRSRGQGTTELALGLLVFITVLMFGIHFAEMGHLSLKVQEAGAYATWESVGRQVEVLENSSTAPFNGTPSAVANQANREYADFNGLTGTSGSSTVVQALTRANRLNVVCQPQGGLTFVPSTPHASIVYRDEGGLECQASAEIEAFRIPTQFLDQADGFFSQQHRRPGWIHFCSVGPSDGTSNCPGWMGVLTNDWGLSGDDESDACNVSGSGGCNYSQIVERMFSSPGNAGLAFAQRYAGTPGTNESVYYFSYKGIEDGYTNDVGGEGQPTFNTGGPGSPSGTNPYSTGHNCFLGMAGPGCS